MNFTWVPFQPLIGRFLQAVLPDNMVLRIPQGKLKGKKWVVGSSNIHAVLGSYEYEMRLLFEDTVKLSGVVYDIGAHVGFYTLLASELVGETGSVIAFEPIARNLQYLKKHLTLNHCTNVTVLEKAVSDRRGKCLFKIDSSKDNMGHFSASGDTEVEICSIDELVASHQIPAPNYLKIDVEGAEDLVLKGAEKTLAEYGPTIFLETHSPELIKTCCEFLKSLNYKLKPVLGTELSTSRHILAFRES